MNSYDAARVYPTGLLGSWLHGCRSRAVWLSTVYADEQCSVGMYFVVVYKPATEAGADNEKKTQLC